MKFPSAVNKVLRSLSYLSLLILLLGLSPWPGGCLAQSSYQGLTAQDNRFVYDYANVFDDVFEQQFNQELIAFKDSTSNVIVVVSHPDFFGEAPWKFATDLGHAWGVASADKDNGIVIVLKPKVGNQRGEVHIAVGYGLEGAIPDAMAKRIVEGEMIPRFKQNDYAGGVYNGTEVLKKLAAGEIKEYAPRASKQSNPLFLLLFILFFFGIIFGAMALRAHQYAKINHIGFWAAWMLLAQSSQHHTGTYGRFRGGGFGGGGGGSSFGGFGGGGFGGGGAGGSW